MRQQESAGIVDAGQDVQVLRSLRLRRAPRLHRRSGALRLLSRRLQCLPASPGPASGPRRLPHPAADVTKRADCPKCRLLGHHTSSFGQNRDNIPRKYLPFPYLSRAQGPSSADGKNTLHRSIGSGRGKNRASHEFRAQNRPPGEAPSENSLRQKSPPADVPKRS